MAIKNYKDKYEFGKHLNRALSPSSPISSIEYLYGRQKELTQIERALMSKGRNIFIFGERGVGKTSLAKTAANQYQSSDREFIDVSCAPDTSIKNLVSNIALQAFDRRIGQSKKRSEEYGLKFKWISYLIRNEETLEDFSNKLKSLGDCVEVLKEVAEIHSERPIIVVDEVDRMTDKNEITLLADLIKQLGDKEVDIKIIFTGVGATIHDILGAHQSAIRQLETIELPRLSWEGRFEIIQNVLNKFDIDICRDIYIRIAAVSDGFPYYVHLILEKLLWVLWEKEEVATEVEWDDFYNAINVAIKDTVAEFSKPYEMALKQRTKDYEEVMWATAVVDWQGDYLKEMYKMYDVICEQVRFDLNKIDFIKLNYSQFSSRIKNLTTENCGKILLTKFEYGKGYYTFREKMMRGYIRMQAEANQIEISTLSNEKNVSNVIHVASRRTGYHASKLPGSIRFKMEEENPL